MPESAIERKPQAKLTQEEGEHGVMLTPRVDILETDDELLLYVDLPGVKSEDVDVRFENGELTLHGRRTPSYTGRPWLWEYESGNFHRAFRVAENIAAGKIHADLKDGVMILHLPKVETAKPRRIAIKSA